MEHQKSVYTDNLLTIPYHLEVNDDYVHKGVVPDSLYRVPWKKVPSSTSQNKLHQEAKQCKMDMARLGNSSLNEFGLLFSSTMSVGDDDDEVIPSSNPNSPDFCEATIDTNQETTAEGREIFKKDPLPEIISHPSNDDRFGTFEVLVDTPVLKDYLSHLPDLGLLVKRIHPMNVKDPLLLIHHNATILKGEKHFVPTVPVGHTNASYDNEANVNWESYTKYRNNPQYEQIEEIWMNTTNESERRIDCVSMAKEHCPNLVNISPCLTYTMKQLSSCLQTTDITKTELETFSFNGQSIAVTEDYGVHVNKDLCKEVAECEGMLESPLETVAIIGHRERSPVKTRLCELRPFIMPSPQARVISAETCSRVTRKCERSDSFFNEVIALRLPEPSLPDLPTLTTPLVPMSLLSLGVARDPQSDLSLGWDFYTDYVRLIHLQRAIVEKMPSESHETNDYKENFTKYNLASYPDGSSTEMPVELLKKKTRNKTKTITVNLNENYLRSVTLIESHAVIYLTKLRDKMLLPCDISHVSSMSPQYSRFLLKQYEKTLESSHRECDIYQSFIILHVLASVLDIISNCCLESTVCILNSFLEKYQDTVRGRLDELREQLIVQHNELNTLQEFHPKISALVAAVRQWQTRRLQRSPGSNPKVLIVTKRELVSLYEILMRSLSPLFNTTPCVITDVPVTSDVVMKMLGKSNCVIVNSTKLQPDFVWAEFDLVVDYEAHGESTSLRACIAHNIRHISLAVHAPSLPTNISPYCPTGKIARVNGGNEHGVSEHTGTMGHSHIVLCSRTVTSNTELLRILETKRVHLIFIMHELQNKVYCDSSSLPLLDSLVTGECFVKVTSPKTATDRYDITVIELDVTAPSADMQTADVGAINAVDIDVDETSGILLMRGQDIEEAWQLEPIVTRVIRLSYKYTYLLIIIQYASTNDKQRSGVFINIAKLYATLENYSLSVKDYCVKFLALMTNVRQVVTCATTADVASSISKTLYTLQSTAQTAKQQSAIISAFSENLPEDYKFLLCLPCLNPFSIHQLLQAATLKELLTSPLKTLQPRFSETLGKALTKLSQIARYNTGLHVKDGITAANGDNMTQMVKGDVDAKSDDSMRRYSNNQDDEQQIDGELHEDFNTNDDRQDGSPSPVVLIDDCSMSDRFSTQPDSVKNEQTEYDVVLSPVSYSQPNQYTIATIEMGDGSSQYVTGQQGDSDERGDVLDEIAVHCTGNTDCGYNYKDSNSNHNVFTSAFLNEVGQMGLHEKGSPVMNGFKKDARKSIRSSQYSNNTRSINKIALSPFLNKYEDTSEENVDLDYETNNNIDGRYHGDGSKKSQGIKGGDKVESKMNSEPVYDITRSDINTIYSKIKIPTGSASRFVLGDDVSVQSGQSMYPTRPIMKSYEQFGTFSTEEIDALTSQSESPASNSNRNFNARYCKKDKVAPVVSRVFMKDNESSLVGNVTQASLRNQCIDSSLCRNLDYELSYRPDFLGHIQSSAGVPSFDNDICQRPRVMPRTQPSHQLNLQSNPVCEYDDIYRCEQMPPKFMTNLSQMTAKRQNIPHPWESPPRKKPRNNSTFSEVSWSPTDVTRLRECNSLATNMLSHYRSSFNRPNIGLAKPLPRMPNMPVAIVNPSPPMDLDDSQESFSQQQPTAGEEHAGYSSEADEARRSFSFKPISHAHVSTKKRLSFEKVPGAKGGQTRLTFM